MKDRELGMLPRFSTLSREAESRRVKKHVRMIIYGCWGMAFIAALMYGIALFGPMPSRHSPDELIHAEQIVSEAAHQLAIRGDCNETAAFFESADDAMTAKALSFSGTIPASQFVTDASQAATAMSAEATSEAAGESVPVSTQTSLSTIYSVRNSSAEHTWTSILTSTTTGTTIVTVFPVPQYTEASVSDDTCQEAVTETVVVTVYPAPVVTITAGPSTVTDVDTQVSYTSGLPDVTLSGRPSTYTAVQTDVTYTTGPPDATVSQDPSTITNVQTDVSVTTGLPDATVSGDASTVTDVQISWSWPLTTTYATPITTLTISDLWGPVPPPPSTPSEGNQASLSSQVTITVSYPTASISSSLAGEVVSPSPSSPPTSTYTKIVTETGGPPALSTTTVDVPPPSYTSYNSSITSSTPSSSTSTPVVISGGNKRPGPKAWGGSNGSSNIACTVMLIAVVMLTL